MNILVVFQKKMKRNIKQDINKFKRNGRIDVLLIDRNDKYLPKAISDYYNVYNHSWKGGESDPDFHGKLASYFASKGKLRLFILYFKNNEKGGIDSHLDNIDTDQVNINNLFTPIAVSYFIVHGSRAYYLKKAYKEDYSQFSSGTLLMWFAVKYLIDEEKCTTIDLQKGDDSFKMKWRGYVHEVKFCFLMANQRSFKGRLVLLIENTFVPFAKKIVKKLNFSKKCIK